MPFDTHHLPAAGAALTAALDKASRAIPPAWPLDEHGAGPVICAAKHQLPDEQSAATPRRSAAVREPVRQ